MWLRAGRRRLRAVSPLSGDTTNLPHSLSHQPMLYFLSLCPQIPWCSIVLCYLRYHKPHPLYFDDGSSQHVCSRREKQTRPKSYIWTPFLALPFFSLSLSISICIVVVIFKSKLFCQKLLCHNLSESELNRSLRLHISRVTI